MSQQHEVIGDRYSLHSLWKRESGFYHARVRDLQTGRVWQFSTKQRSKRKAKQAAIKAIERQLSKEEDRRNQVRLDDALTGWLQLKSVADSTEEVYGYIKKVIVGAFAGLLVDELDHGHVEHFMKRLSDKGRSAATRKYYLTFLRSFFQWARRKRYCAHDPTDGIRMPRAPKRQPIILTVQEARKLLHACKQPAVAKVNSATRGKWTQTKAPPKHLFLATLIALHTGLRRSNILGLRWKHIDFEKRVIRIPAEEMKAHADHVVPVHDELWTELRNLFDRTKSKKRRKPRPDQLVLGPLGEFKNSWASALKRAGLSLTFHSTRKTFASWLAEDAPYAVVQALLGHALPDVTGRYVNVSIDRMRKAIHGLPRLLDAEKQEEVENAEESGVKAG